MIKALRNRFYFPLFARDLTQMAGRKSTYVARFLFILALLGAFFFLSGSALSLNDNGAQALQLGVGGRLFNTLMQGQSVALMLLTPLLCCGAIAQEKERDALETLLLTRLSPWKIVLEKYFSRIFPLFLYLLCTLPLLVYLYSLGGVTMFDIWFSFYLMSLTILQLGAFTMMWSAYANTSMSALIYSVVATIFIYAVSSLMIEAVFFRILPRYIAGSYGQMGFLNELPRNILPSLQFAAGQRYEGTPFSEILKMLVMRTGPIWVSILAALGMARFFLIRRVSVRTQNIVYAFFKRLDTFFNNANKVTGGVVLIPENQSLPLFEPVAWKETRKTAIGTARYRIRVLVALEFPTLFICLLATSGRGTQALDMLSLFLWGVVSLLLIVKTTGLITSERLHQTLDVILVSPMSGRDILFQKMKGVQGFCLFLCIPLLTTVIFKSYMILARGGMSYLFYSVLFMGILLYALVWVCMYTGLRINNSMRSVFTALGIIGFWSFIPLSAAFFLPSEFAIYMINISPFQFLQQLGNTSDFNAIVFVQFFIAFTSAAGMALYFRLKCLDQVDTLLGRQTDQTIRTHSPKDSPDLTEQSPTEVQPVSST